MCDYDFFERQEWIRKMEQLRKEMDELERPRKPAPAPAASEEPKATEPEPLPV